jgi:hypothetical protein
MARSGTSPRPGYERQSQGYRTRRPYGDRAQGSYHRIVSIAGALKPAIILNSTLVTSHSQSVDLRYPSRPDALAIQNLTLTFQPGVSYAFCGASGSGKSRFVVPAGHPGQAHVAHLYYSSYVQCLGATATVLRTDRWQDYDRRRRYQVVGYGHRTRDDGLRQPRGRLVPRNDPL